MKVRNRLFEIPQKPRTELRRDSEFTIQYLGNDFSIRRFVDERIHEVIKWTKTGHYWAKEKTHDVSKAVVFNEGETVASFYESTRVPGTRHVYVETYRGMRLTDGIALAQRIGLLPEDLKKIRSRHIHKI